MKINDIKNILIDELIKLRIKTEFEDRQRGKTRYVKKTRIYQDLINFINEEWNDKMINYENDMVCDEDIYCFDEEEERRNLELQKKNDEIEKLENELEDYKYYWKTLSEWLNLLVEEQNGQDSINYRGDIKISHILAKMAELERK